MEISKLALGAFKSFSIRSALQFARKMQSRSTPDDSRTPTTLIRFVCLFGWSISCRQATMRASPTPSRYIYIYISSSIGRCCWMRNHREMIWVEKEIISLSNHRTFFAPWKPIHTCERLSNMRDCPGMGKLYEAWVCVCVREWVRLRVRVTCSFETLRKVTRTLCDVFTHTRTHSKNAGFQRSAEIYIRARHRGFAVNIYGIHVFAFTFLIKFEEYAREWVRRGWLNVS